MLPPKTAHVFLDSLPINGVFVLEDAELMKFITLLLKAALALMDWQELMELVKSAPQGLHQLPMEVLAQPAKLMRFWLMDNANAVKDTHTTLVKSALFAQAFPMDF